MNVRGIWLILVFALGTYKASYSQVNSLFDEDLESLKESKQFEKYFDKIAEYGKAVLTDSASHTLKILSSLLNRDFGPLTSREKLILRKTAIRLANYTYRLEGYNQQVQQLYILAHENVSNLNYLDSLSWYAENELCIIFTITGDYDKADYYGGLLDRSLRKYGMKEKLARFYANKGRLLKSAYKTEEAIKVFQKGYHYADSIQYINGIFSNALNLAEVFNEDTLLGDPLYYLQIAFSTLPAYISEESFPEKKSAIEIEYGKYLISKGAVGTAMSHFDTALVYLKTYYVNHHRREFSKFYLELGGAYFKADSLDLAIKSINQGITALMPEFNGNEEAMTKSQLYADNSISELSHLKSRILQSLYARTRNNSYLKKALVCLEMGLSVNDKMRELVVADPSKLIGIRTNKMMITRSIEILLQLYNEDPDPNYLLKVRSLFNRSKSVLYTEKILDAHISNRLKQEDREKLLILQRKLLTLHDRKLDANADLVAIHGQILLLHEQIDTLFSPYQSFELKIQRPDDYIEYVVEDSVIYSLAEFGDVQQFLKIGDTEKLLNLIARLEEFIALKDLSIDVNILQDLYSFLLKPFGNKMPERIVIIPDGPIGFIPFEMLKDENGKYLIYGTTISYAFEFETSYSETETTNSSVDHIYCLSPIYPMRGAKGNLLTRGGLYHLPYAKMEVDTISSLFGKDALISESSQKSDWLENIQKSNVFHYAGHAIISGEHAYLALTASDILSEQLTAFEISLLPHPLDLVVLSACETGLGKLEYGEGIRSLGRSFMEGGTKSTVISLWNVNDKSTARIMTAFYKYLKLGNTKDDALRNAKLDYLRVARTQHPFYWAAFIPAGNMKSL